jgi:hypothetical protein
VESVSYGGQTYATSYVWDGVTSCPSPDGFSTIKPSGATHCFSIVPSATSFSTYVRSVSSVAQLQSIGVAAGIAVDTAILATNGLSYQWTAGTPTVPCSYPTGGNGGTQYCAFGSSPSSYRTDGYWQAQYSGAVQTSWFSPTCNGTANDHSALQSAIVAAQATTGQLIFSATSAPCQTSSTLYVNAPIIISGPPTGTATVSTATTGIPVFNITSSNVTISGISCTGPQHATENDNEACIVATGTFNAGASPAYINNINLNHLVISNFGLYGIEGLYIDGFHFDDNTISSIRYAAILGISVSHGTIKGNNCENINTAGMVGVDNAYCYSVTRNTTDSGELTSQPNSDHVIISNNICSNVPTWECYDTHSGQYITFQDNIGTGSYFGINAGSSKDQSGTDTYSPNGIIISGNTLESGNEGSGIAAYGIALQGASTTALATGTIGPNEVSNFGNQTLATGAAVLIENTSGVAINGLSIFHPTPIGILFNGNNTGTVLGGTSIIDPWTNTAGVGQADAIELVGGNNDVLANGVLAYHYSPFSATYVLTSASGEFLRLSSSTDSFHAGLISTNATTLFVASGSASPANILNTNYFKPPTTCPAGSTGILYNNSGTAAFCP